MANPTALATPKRRIKPIIVETDSGVGSGSNDFCEPGNLINDLAEEDERRGRKRKKNLRTQDVQKAMAASALSDRNALNDAEALRRMFMNPVYGDPTNPEEEDFSDLAVRFAQRGLRWIRLASTHGITMATRRIRSGTRAFYGYGINKPSSAPQLFSEHEEYGRARSEYLNKLMNLIRDVEEANRRCT